MGSGSCKDYLKARVKLWESQRFQRIDVTVRNAPVFHRREFSLTRLGLVDIFIVPTCIKDELTPGYLTGFSSDVYDAGLQNKSFIPRGFGSLMIVYPLLVVEQHKSLLYQFITQDYMPTHRAAFEFPVVYSLEKQTALTLEKTPVFGAIYYNGLRSEARQFFS